MGRSHSAIDGDDRRASDRFWQWQAGVAALEKLLAVMHPIDGFLVSFPSPIVKDSHLKTYVLMPQGRSLPSLPPTDANPAFPAMTFLPSVREGMSSFCLLLSPEVNLLLVYQGERGLHFSFDPEEIHAFWQQLRQQLPLTELHPIDQWFTSATMVPPSYRLVSEFAQWLLEYSYPEAVPLSVTATPMAAADISLLQALAHEVRTPLTTINTFIQLLQRQENLPQRTYQYLQKIGQEIQDQITRFNLLSDAAEIFTSPSPKPPLAFGQTHLAELFITNLTRWQKQAARRQVKLTVDCPSDLPVVLSNPTSLDQVLTGLVEYYSQTLAPESELQLVVQRAGQHVKLELRSPQYKYRSDLAVLGHFLLWHPATGQLSLNFEAAKLLIEAVGAKVIQRRDRQAGEILTLYLPIAEDSG
ncbi:MAG: histidine kinase dimerization/phospho-acceptor domain-containing protein [Thermosynechococcus sp. Uc]|uniref:sensor histidine kinase n=1 Tax=Thermosynechococcus sp. Uc TaxID=3034853 RepID=UPI00259DA5E0|nr:histidine kinase dimerization/phospho-acceptor domain-containing protein [Thermosynechococcus sp. Uc]MDM7326931.1 histidine kinase dimerization/phospho-acceptor domain-containing protein [Thermosynechococcus sp. Uc]